jgi:hypothetical protein
LPSNKTIGPAAGTIASTEIDGSAASEERRRLAPVAVSRSVRILFEN